MRDLDQLTAVDKPAWPRITRWITAAGVKAVVRPAARAQGEAVIYRLQVSASASLGGLALNAAGLVIDHGWLRVLGAGDEGMAGLADWNNLSGGGQRPRLLVVAHDAMGGIYAVNGGALAGPPGQVHFFSPQDITWTDTGLLHGAWLKAVLGGALSWRPDWVGRDEEIAALRPDEALLVEPPLFADDPQPMDTRTRRVVSAGELWQAHRELLRARSQAS